MKISFPVRIYLIALILRLIPVLLTRDLGIGLDDMFQYDMLARSLASGHGYRWYAEDDLKLLKPYVDFDLSTAKNYDPQFGLYTSFRAPLYPTFLAVVYFFAGQEFSRFFFARFAQVLLLGASLAPLTYLVSLHLFPKSERAAKISAWIVACYPMLLVYPLGLGTENLFFVLLLISFLFLLKSIKQPSAFSFLLSGLFLALTALTRSVILPFVGLAFVYVIARSVVSATKQSHVQSKGLLHSLSLVRNDGVLMLISFFLVIAPWVIRNSLLHHNLTGIETSIGYNLYLGYHPKGNGSFVFGPSLDLLTILDDAKRDEVGTQKAIEFIRSQPERFLHLALNRLGFFFGLEKRVLIYFYSNNLLGYIPKPILLTIAAVLLLPFVFLSTLAVVGLVSLKGNPNFILLGLLFFSYLLPHVFVLSEDRFHLALIPFFAILAANAFDLIRNKQLHFSKLVGTLAVFLIFLLFVNWGLELWRDADKITALLGPGGNKTWYPY